MHRTCAELIEVGMPGPCPVVHGVDDGWLKASDAVDGAFGSGDGRVGLGWAEVEQPLSEVHVVIVGHVLCRGVEHETLPAEANDSFGFVHDLADANGRVARGNLADRLFGQHGPLALSACLDLGDLLAKLGDFARPKPDLYLVPRVWLDADGCGQLFIQLVKRPLFRILECLDRVIELPAVVGR